MIDRDNLYQAEMCATDRPPSLHWDEWLPLGDAIDEYDRKKQAITLIRVDKG